VSERSPHQLIVDDKRKRVHAASSALQTLENGIDEVADFVERAAPAVIKGARLPLGLLLIALLFLLIQHEIDRRDPKLALAPSYADPDLAFDDVPIPVEA
jgi:hypothetical protein